MTTPPNKTAAPDSDSELHAVAWVRGVRDQMYEATSGLSTEELIEFVRHAAASAGDKSNLAGGRAEKPTN